jgi:hypothetical protein
VSTKIKSNYIDNKLFLEDIKRYHLKLAEHKRLGKPAPPIPPFSSRCILLLAERIASMTSFVNYSYSDEMMDDAIENCVLYFDRFDPTKWDNPFAYFSTVVQYAFMRRIKKEEKERYTICKFFDTTLIGTESEALLLDENNRLIHATTYDNILEFINNFEERERKAKEAKARKAAGLAVEKDKRVKRKVNRRRAVNSVLYNMSDTEKANLVQQYLRAGGKVTK